MMERHLFLCYDSIFYGLPLRMLKKYENWEKAHAMRFESIENLHDFYEHFDDALQIFRDNNFAEEYATLYAKKPESFPDHQAPLPRHSTSSIVSRLRSLRDNIETLGVQAVEDAIDQRSRVHQDGALRTSIRAFISHPHHMTPSQTPIHGGAHFHISQLLDRLYKTINFQENSTTDRKIGN
jgi:hypothetical protein